MLTIHASVNMLDLTLLFIPGAGGTHTGTLRCTITLILQNKQIFSFK